MGLLVASGFMGNKPCLKMLTAVLLDGKGTTRTDLAHI